MSILPGYREKVTVYFASEFTGRIVRREGRLVRVEDFTDPGRAHRGADVILVRKGGRAEERISSYFWVAVDGWGHPDPDPGRDASGRGRHAAHDPAQVDEFLRGVGAHLRARLLLSGKALSILPGTRNARDAS